MRQPSQLKSSVRSLANKDETTSNKSSFASRKVADVGNSQTTAKVPEQKEEADSNQGKTEPVSE